MEECDNGKGADLNGNLVRPPSLRPLTVLKSTSSGRSSPRASPTFRRLNSVRTPRRDSGRGTSGSVRQWFRSSRLVYWLLLITLWTYGGFYIQSRWAHGDNGENTVRFSNNMNDDIQDSVQNQLRRELIPNDSLVKLRNGSGESQLDGARHIPYNLDVMAKKKNGTSPALPTTSRKKSKKSARTKGRRRKKTVVEEVVNRDEELHAEEIPQRNTSYGLLLGPFGSIEDTVLEWSPEKRTGTCDRNELFARLVWSRNFVLIFHELSMTGAPLSMLELATELLSCGATVHAVVLSRRGGLMSEFTRRKIKVIDDKAEHSFKAAMKADLVIAGSAVCASWIEQYLAHFSAGSNQIAWWIMENRREYFDRSKLVLNRVKMLIFLSELQSKQWLTWAEEEKIKLYPQIALIPLSVNDELAFVAGLTSSLNTPRFTPEVMLGKRQVLRKAVRQEMGLSDEDMLVLTLSSINAPKGQLLLLESAHLLIDEQKSHDDTMSKASIKQGLEGATLRQRFRLKGLHQKQNETSALQKGMRLRKRMNVASDASVSIRKSDDKMPEQNLKFLIGSVGSKSNKVPYVKEILEVLSRNPNLSNSVLWTPATTRVASLYSAADVYAINAQGLGETFGRVTIEAMAFGLPILGTDAGGTKEIVEHNVTGLLHPAGRPGNRILAENLKFLLKNLSARQQMGIKGRERVEKMYMKRHMYKMFFEVLFKCMRMK